MAMAALVARDPCPQSAQVSSTGLGFSAVDTGTRALGLKSV